MGDIRIGTASWTDRTLLDSGWYPPRVSTAADRLAYYASRFRIVEVDSTYYALPAERTASLWAQRTPAGFTFNVKAFSLLTHHPTKPTALPRELRATAAEAAGSGGNLYLRDAEPWLVEQVWERFLAALRPLVHSDRLGAIVLQFPVWFPIGRDNKRYIVDCRRRCAPLRVCVEFRNHTWMSEDNREETLRFLSDHGIPYVCVDMPQGYSGSIPPIAAATADLAVVRFHGRSAEWNSNDIRKRFGYRYSEAELAEWVPELRKLAAEADTVHVLMNNCYRDYAQTNAQQLVRLLDLDAPSV